MIYDYDLVVIGDSPEAAFAAERAGRLRARVAWVTQVPTGKRNDPDCGGNPALRAEVMLEVLRQAVGNLGPGEVVADPQGLWDRARGCADVAVAERDPQRLQELRVDVIEGLGRFETRPRLQLNVDGQLGMRELRSRNYLLAPAAHPFVPPSLQEREGLETLHSWTAWQRLPQHLVMVGAAPEGLALAQVLVRLGCAVTVIALQASLLPSFDSELAELATGLLQASGVELRLNEGSLEDCVAQAQTLIAEDDDARLMVAEGWRPHWPGLNLEAVDLSGEVAAGSNAKLRTRHRHVYGCGAAIAHGPGRDNLARHQAEVALRNGLWWPWWRAEEETVVKTLALSPMLAQVGLTEAQAQQQYSGQVTVIRCYAKDSEAFQERDQTMGICKLVLHRSGQLLGAQALAAGAEDWMAIAAQTIQQKGSVKDLEKLSIPPKSSASLLHQAAAQWRWDRLAENPRREDLIERFFNWRRTGSV